MTKDPREPHATTPEDLVAKITDSDPNGNTPEGLAGEMGVSSERVAPMRGSTQDNTHGAGPEHPGAPYDAEDQAQRHTTPGFDEAPPEQNADAHRGPEVQPDLPPRTRPTQQAPNPLGPGPDHEPDESWRTVQPGEPGEDAGAGPHGESDFDVAERAKRGE